MDVKTQQILIEFLAQELEDYWVTDSSEREVSIEVNSEGIIVKDGEKEILIPKKDAETFKTLLRDAEVKCKGLSS